MMRAVVLASAAGTLGVAPLAAQSNAAAAVPPPATSTDIGPGELSNFSLNGTVTRPADRPPASAPPPAVGPEPVAPASRGDDRPAGPPATDSPVRSQPQPSNSDLFRRPPTLPDATGANAVMAAPPVDTGDRPAAAAPALAEGFSLLPWIVALLAAAGAGVMFVGFKRRQHRFATQGNAPIDITRREMPEPRPASQPASQPAPRAAPAPAPTGSTRRPLPTTLMPPPTPEPGPVRPEAGAVRPGAIVSTSLRPWIDVELTPDRALLDESGAAIAFEVTLFNSGSAVARDVIIEAKLFNAGANQEAELSAFFTAERAPGDPIPLIAPYARIPLRSAVRLPRAEIREYEIEGRKLFMPLVAISIRYRWSSGDGQSAAGFLVGQGKAGQDKLAPLRVDRGARSWRELGARRYEKGLRS